MQALDVSKLYIASDGSAVRGGGGAGGQARRRRRPAITVAAERIRSRRGVLRRRLGRRRRRGCSTRRSSATRRSKLFAPSALDDADVRRGAVAVPRATCTCRRRASCPSDLTPARPDVRPPFKSDLRPRAGRRRRSSATRRCRRVLAVLRQAGTSANDRATVVKDFFGHKEPQLGRWAPTRSTPSGDTSLAPFVFSRVVPASWCRSSPSSAGVRRGWAVEGGDAVARARDRAARGAGGAAAAAAPSTTVGNRIPGKTLTIYLSVPAARAPRASAARRCVGGARLALAEVHGRIGEYRIVLRSLDDSTAKRGDWDPGQTTINARLAMLDPTTIGYIGEFNSGASAISIPAAQPCRDPADQPDQHRRRADLGRARRRPRRARRSTTRRGSGRSPGWSRPTPSRRRAQVRLQQSRVHARPTCSTTARSTARTPPRASSSPPGPAHLKLAGVQAFDPRVTGLPLAGRGGRQDRRRLRADQRDHRGQRGAADQADRGRDAQGEDVRDRRTGREHVRRSEPGRDPAVARPAGDADRSPRSAERRLRPPAGRSGRATSAATAIPSPTRSSATRR